MKTLIIAPHIDDEMIGCWSVLQDRARDITVCFGYELTPERRAEALKLVQFNVALVFGFDNLEPDLSAYKEVYVPSRRDWHAQHKITNSKFRGWATHFYSVDMEAGVYLGDAESKTKRAALDDIYPSQASLWATNAKYYLFEDIQSKDYAVQAILHSGDLRIEVPKAYEAATLTLLGEFDAEILFNKLLGLIPVGKVRVSTPYTIYET